MIGYLHGKILLIDDNKVILNVNNVGYEVYVPAFILKNLNQDQEVDFYIRTEVRETAFDLYGFLNLDQKDFFKKLLSVPGVGPKTALNLMTFSVEELSEAMRNEDIKKLTSIGGLGKKTAERLILELQHKLPDKNSYERAHRSVRVDVMNALNNLGYKQKDIETVLSEMPEEIVDSETIIKYFLKNI